MQQMLRDAVLTSPSRGLRATSPRGEDRFACEAAPSAAQPVPPGQGTGRDFRLPFCGQLIPFFASW